MVGDILNAALDLYKRHWKHLIGIALSFYLIAGSITLVLTIAFGAYGALAGAIVLLIGIFWLTGALVLAVADIRDGREDFGVKTRSRRSGRGSGRCSAPRSWPGSG